LSQLLERLHALAPAALTNLRRGIEKESLRATPDGALARTPHPAALGAALTHPHITTDFSEAQLELITGVHASPEACLAELTEIHQFVYRNIGDEILWCASMPCGLPAEDRIPIGQYGRSNSGRLKTVYRIGLAHRYGRRMQTISGIHYNFSMPGVSSAG
jgi:glutamate--cysteine ligase